MLAYVASTALGVHSDSVPPHPSAPPKGKELSRKQRRDRALSEAEKED